MTIAVSLATRAGTAFAAYREGDTGRLAELVDLLSPILWRAARAQHVCAADAEEIVQVAWLRLLDHADDIVEPAAVLTWLIVTVKREAWRRSGRATHEVSTDLHDAVMPETTPGPEHQAVLTERQRVLWHHVQRLSPTCRHLLCVIAFAERPDYDSVARALGRPVGSIGPTRGRCLAKLRNALATDPEWCAEP
ncbi:MAG TPA: sigma-70 family RNA polymerase sigma factor [Tetrasphaera sp.]|uniref:RNA polymerase sigma factor n=1 Tax=Nostocoides sp. TaxID=1917966 RepID=UPI002CEE3EBC|nr:sigma-70 family RNA polymerase sigma factor [Tetrasphaera sp.]HNQ06915.1 sigma-70 family RNA polymerase sigma factor [Tetrasphaera sp.]